MIQKRSSRRGFLHKAAMLPAAMAAVSRPGSGFQQELPQVRIGKHSISRLIMGTNPIYGLSHMSQLIDYEMKAFYTLEQIVATLLHAQELGINCVQNLQAREYQGFREKGGKMLLLSNGEGAPSSVAKTAQTGCIGIHHFGVRTDQIFKQGKLDSIQPYLKAVRDAGLLVGVGTHMPEVVDAVESKGWDIDYYMTSIYQFGRTRKEYEKNYPPGQITVEAAETEEFADVYLRSDPPRMFKFIQQTKKPCLAFKILAAGRRAQKPKQVEQAFKETFANIKPSDAVIVGMYPRYTDQVEDNADYVRQFGTKSV